MDKDYLHAKHFEVPLYRGNLVVILTNSYRVRDIVPNFEEEDIYAHALLDNYRNRVQILLMIMPQHS